MRSRLRAIFALVGIAAVSACTHEDPARQLVQESIEVHGGDEFERMDLTFTFRETRFRVHRDRGRYVYERRFTDDEGAEIREWMTNEETGRQIDGQPVTLTPADRDRVETAVNSVVYFGFLPFRLLDPAARLRELDSSEIEGTAYRKVEITFDPRGGGLDWEDRFVYWFHPDDRTLDYLAYRYHRDGGGTRFRRAVNRREVGGLLVQDYENFTAELGVDDIADYDRLFVEGRLTFISRVELEGITTASPLP